ncbi:uncharacterized protein LOC123544285 [Mercenaria mercenaria]|uniref:uncharacterized protein LOC123544285 n=1 Tax=Mercenaria mercenaria TaxID=6596 RepID=UPI00234F2FA3|nr:uncharacterized protein LOC123544285 [Mercenaria mercenaria]
MFHIYILGIFFCLLNRCDAIRCFECQHVPFPRDCTKVIECGVDQYCFTEQLVTTGGNVVFNTGCLNNTRCSPSGTSLIGKRSKSPSDIKTCMECCKSDFCNKIGCGTREIPLTQRGPYCFNCDAAVDPKACNDVTICGKNELCMLYSPLQYDGFPQTIYKGQCVTQQVCDVVSKALSSRMCAPICCKTDLCNDHCGISSNITTTSNILTTHTTQTKHPAVDMSTQSIFTTQGTSDPTTIPTNNAHFHCDTHAHYIHLQNANAQLCVHMVLKHVTWKDARHACKQEGGDLVVLDTHEKAVLIRNKIAESQHLGFWIGARDFNQNDHFLWINQHPVDDSLADWGHNQPDHIHHGIDQDCVYMPRHANYTWHDTDCEKHHYDYICEKQ